MIQRICVCPFEGKVVVTGVDAVCRERVSQLKRRLANPLVTIGFDHWGKITDAGEPFGADPALSVLHNYVRECLQPYGRVTKGPDIWLNVLRLIRTREREREAKYLPLSLLHFVYFVLLLVNNPMDLIAIPLGRVCEIQPTPYLCSINYLISSAYGELMLRKGTLIHLRFCDYFANRAGE